MLDLPESEVREMAEGFREKARTNRVESRIHFGSDITPGAIERNQKRGIRQLVEADKLDRWADALLATINQ